MKLIVVGAGIAGSSAARVARHKGWEVTVVDGNPGQAASRCALATIRPAWFDKATQNDCARSWDWYKAWDAAVAQEATVTHWRNLIPKRQNGWWLIQPESVLVQPDYRQNAVEVQDTTVTLEGGEKLEADAVLVTVGAYGKTLHSDFKGLAGATLVSNDAHLDYEPLRVHHIRPYHSITAANLGHEVRFGSSINKDLDKAVEEVWEMLKIGIEVGMVQPDVNWRVISGIRARQSKNVPLLPVAGKRSTTMGNLARSGYAISPAVVEKWINSL